MIAASMCDARAFPARARQVARYKALHILGERRNAPTVLDQRTLASLEPHWRTYDLSTSGDLTEFLRECLEALKP